MNFLELVQAVWRETGAGGSQPVSVENQKGESLRLVEWVRSADMSIQNKWQDWKFLWGQYSFETEVGKSIYYPGLSVDIMEIDKEATFLDGSHLRVEQYIDVRGEPPVTAEGRPFRMVMMPDTTLRMDGPPDQEYPVSFDYWAAPLPLATNEDISRIPARFHEVIIGRAMVSYGMYENAEDVSQHGSLKLQEWLTKLESDQLPGDRHMHSVAEGNDWVMSVE